MSYTTTRASPRPPPPPSQPNDMQTPTQPQPRKPGEGVFIWSRIPTPSMVQSPTPRSPGQPPNQPPPPRPLKLAPPRTPPPSQAPPPPQLSDGPDDPIIRTVAHIPYTSGVEMGTVRGVHRSDSGVVWVEYPNNTTLWEVPRCLLFPYAEDGEKHRQQVVGGKKKAKPLR